MGKRASIARSDYKSEKEYKQAFAELKKSYECRAKIDDGNGGTGWMFFESRQDMEMWKNQK